MSEKSNNTIDGLRKILFDAMRGLTDKNEPLDIERAKAVADLGQVVINSAKVEIQFLAIDGARSEFIAPGQAALPNGTGTVAEGPGYTVTRHRLKG